VILAAPPQPGIRATPGRRPIDVIIPLYRGAAQAEACCESAAAGLPPEGRIVAVDDAIPEPALRAWADRAAAAGRMLLLRHAHNRGFPAAVNTALRHAAGRDVLLLNSDAVLPHGAIARLADAAYAAPDTGTATPMTGDGVTAIAVGPATGARDRGCVHAADADAQAANPGLRIELPTCAGFCVFIRHDCLAETGLLREQAFAQGYGEENDFSRRASLLGWRHVAACDVFVAHEGGVSFGAAGPKLRARNQDILERLHPGYAALVADFAARDPLAPARAAYAARRWAAGRRDSSVVLVTHNEGGGVERHIAGRVAAIRAGGARAIVVRPLDGFAVCDGDGASSADLVFGSADALADFLRADTPRAVELHHTAAHAPEVTRLAGLLRVPFDIVVHDYAAVCPRITLRANAWYCGEPDDVRDCDDCIADHGARMPFTGGVKELRASQTTLFAAARRVVVPTQGVARRLRRYMPGLRATVQAWEDDAALPVAALPSLDTGAVLHVAVTGAIGADKGFDLLLACARDAARRDSQIRFTVVGGTMDDERLLETGRVFVTGPFAEGEAVKLLREAAPHIGFLPSVWPETWCYALTALWQAGLHVLASDLGAPAERIRARGAGTLLPPGVTAQAVNDTLLGLVSAPATGMAQKMNAHA
jgi:GT2 family glycosyltransferase/glycosyltransferase involved in cell wall biosynthesis